MVVYRPSCVLSDGGNEVSIGPNNDHARIQIGVLIQEIDLPVNKGAQEVTFTKLNDTFWILCTGKIATI